jgi:hypothetical protein
VTARALAESDTLAEATPKVLQAICEALGWDHAALWNVDAEAKLLRRLSRSPRMQCPATASGASRPA